MKKKLVLVSLLVGTVVFTGCGSNNSKNSPLTDTTNFTLVTNKVTCDPVPFVNEGMIFDTKYYADGDISAECKTMNGIYPEYNLRNGVEIFTITQVLRDDEYDIKSNKGKISGIEHYDYKEGTIHYKVIELGKSIDCIETYPSILPLTITSNIDIKNIINWEEDNGNMISSTCPASWYYESDEDDDFKGIISASGISNYIITDSNGKKHLLAEEMTIAKK